MGEKVLSTRTTPNPALRMPTHPCGRDENNLAYGRGRHAFLHQHALSDVRGEGKRAFSEAVKSPICVHLETLQTALCAAPRL